MGSDAVAAVPGGLPQEFRAWLRALTAEQGRELLETNALAAKAINVPKAGKRPDLRKVRPAVGAWAGRATERQLRDVARVTGKTSIADLSQDPSISEEEFQRPDSDQLLHMLTRFSPVTAGLTVFSLATDDLAAAPSARAIAHVVLGWANGGDVGAPAPQMPSEPTEGILAKDLPAQEASAPDSASPGSGSAAADGLAASSSVQAPTSHGSVAPEWAPPSDLSETVKRLRELAEELTALLDDAATSTAAARRLDHGDALLAALSGYATAWTDVVAAACASGVELGDAPTVDDVLRALEDHTAAQQARAAEAAELRQRLEYELQETLEVLGSIDQQIATHPAIAAASLQSVRDDLAAKVLEVQGQIAVLDGAGTAPSAPKDGALSRPTEAVASPSPPVAPPPSARKMEAGPPLPPEPAVTPISSAEVELAATATVAAGIRHQPVEVEPDLVYAHAAPTAADSDGAGAAKTAPPPAARTKSTAAADALVHAPVSDERLASLVAAGRVDAAYWLARTHGSSAARCQALEMLAVAVTATPGDATDATPVLLPADLATAPDPVSGALARVALVHTALLTGREPVALTQLHPLSPSVVSAAEAQLLEAGEAAARMHLRLGEQAPIDEDGDAAESAMDPERELDELAAQVRQRLRDKPRRKLKAARATWVLQDFYGAEGALRIPLEHVERLVSDPGNADRALLADFVRNYESRDAAEALIQTRSAAVVDGRRSFVHLESRPLEALIREVAEVVRIAGTALELSAPKTVGGDRASLSGRLRAAAARVAEEPAIETSLASAAARRLAQNLLAPGGSPSLPLRRPGTAPGVRPALLLVPRFPRAADRAPLPDHEGAAAAAEELAGEPSLVTAVAGHVAAGALDLATAVIDAFGAVEDSDGPGATAGLERVVADGRKNWQDRLQQLRTATADLLAQLRTQNLLDASDTAELSASLEMPPEDDDRWDQQRAQLQEVADYLTVVQQARLDALEAELGSIDRVTDGDRRRVREALDGRDTATAAELIVLLQNGQELSAASSDSGDDLAHFASFLTEHSPTRQREAPDVHILVEAAAQAATTAVPPEAEPAVTSWEALSSPRAHEAQRTHVASVLLALGLDAKQTVRPVNALRLPRGASAFDVRPTPTEGSYVAELGSRSGGSFRVLVLADDRTRRNVLEHVDDAAVTMPHLILYTRPMTAAMREQVHRESCQRSLNAVVVDALAFAWVVATAPRSYRALQRVTLPWSGYSPYTPYVSGVVAREVFAGRKAERSQVMAPDGGTFVFGGRQLGKSALLSRVRDDFSAVSGQHAILLDLKGLGLGESEQPTQLWRHLAFELESRQVLPRGRAARATPDYVQQVVREWLNEDAGRRLLLLLDEADSFLNADSKGREGAGGVAIFPTVNHLKALTESTGRRFRVVYAGLHQVQRFSHLPNVLTVHGGPDVPIGPLDPEAAVELVRDPLAALGYSFESPRLVWHLLAFTNYQASLIQIVCAELLRRLRDDVGGSAAKRPIPITERHVESVLGDPTVRQRVAERLRITINLEDRYRVLALLLALRALDEGHQARSTASAVLDEAQLAWYEGFAGMRDDELAVYLDELVGLGVLVQHHDRTYSVRSPNVVSMLGTREELEAELADADFTFAYEYNPLMARRSISAGRSGSARSPLTEAQLAAAFGDARVGRVPVLCASPLAAPEHLAAAVESLARSQETEVVTALPTSDGSALAVLDLRREEPAAVAARWERLRSQGAAAILVVDPATLPALPEAAQAVTTVARRWTQQSLRAWTEAPVERPALRERLVRSTGGWPLLVERAMAAIQAGERPDDVVAKNEAVPRDRREAQLLLTGIGVDDQLAAALRQWAEAAEVGEVLRREDVSVLSDGLTASGDDLLSALEDRDLVDVHPGGYALEPLTHRCLRLAAG